MKIKNQSVFVTTIFVFILSLSSYSFYHFPQGNNDGISASFNKEYDSVDIWVNKKYLDLLKTDISFCDCWSACKYHLLYCDTSKLEIFLKSNLMHYGHDSEFSLPIIKTKKGYRFDSSLINWPIPAKDIEFISDSRVKLTEGTIEYIFIKKRIQIEKKFWRNGNRMIYPFISDFFYELNSHILLNYDVVDVKGKTSDILIPVDSLHNLILSGKVNGTCSDDYHYNSIVIKDVKKRYFHINFLKDTIELYETQGRDRYQKLRLDTLPKQILLFHNK